MAKIKIENIIGCLDYEFKRALGYAVDNVAPNSNIDSSELYRAFLRGVSKQFGTWVKVPNQYVEKES